VSRLVQEEILPAIGPYEEKSVLPADLLRKMGELGFFRAHVDKSGGGLGLGTLGYCLGSEEIAKAGAGLTHNGHFQVQRMILEFGTAEQKGKYLQGLLDGGFVGAMAITEPQVGSSFALMSSAVEERDGALTLNGRKSFINDAAEARVAGVLARDGDGFSVFLLEKGTTGFRILKKLDPIGMRSSPVYDFAMERCPIRSEDLVGTRGEGLRLFFSAFNFSRLGNASAALGIANAAFQKTLDYAKGRQVGRQRVSEFQGIRWMFAEMSVQLETSRLLRDRAAGLVDAGERAALEASQAKLLCVETSNEVAAKCIQIAGRFGCLRDSLFELYLRDARALGVAGGSLEVMKNNIARELLGN
jgi:butyryl-CoA dehydrogenase